MDWTFWVWLAGAIGTLRLFTKFNLNWIHNLAETKKERETPPDTFDRSCAALLGAIMALVWPIIVGLWLAYKATTYGLKSKLQIENEKKAREKAEREKKWELEQLVKQYKLPTGHETTDDFLTSTGLFQEDVTQFKRSLADRKRISDWNGEFWEYDGD